MTVHRYPRYAIATLGLALVLASPANGVGQTRPSPFLGGVPMGTRTAEPLPISIADAIRRALDHNLGVLQAEEAVNRATGTRWLALGELLPNVANTLALLPPLCAPVALTPMSASRPNTCVRAPITKVP